jgi:hypothetical protein
MSSSGASKPVWVVLPSATQAEFRVSHAPTWYSREPITFPA